MTNLELVKRISERSGFSQKNIIEILDATEITLKELLLIEPQKFKLLDFTLESKMMGERVMINPKTQEKMTTKPRNKITMKFSKDWVRLMRGE